MEKDFFEILSIGEQVEIINNLGGLKKAEEEIGINAKTVGKALKRAKFRYDRSQNVYKIKNYSAEANKKQTNSMELDELSSQKLKSAINMDELSNQKLESAINIDELSSQKLANAISMEELSNQKLIDAININEEAIKFISKNISELNEKLNNNKYQSVSNSGQESTNISQALKSLPKTIETLERTFRINLEVAENFDEFYEDNKEARVQDLISLALQELIDKYK